MDKVFSSRAAAFLGLASSLAGFPAMQAAAQKVDFAGKRIELLVPFPPGGGSDVYIRALAPFMIVIVYFAAYQATHDWADLAVLFVLGVLGMYMKRFGRSRPALLIGFVLSMRLEAAVYQSVQVYGMSFLERTGVLVILALIAVSVFLGVRFKPSRPWLTPDGPHAPVDRAPQMIFLGRITACVVFGFVLGIFVYLCAFLRVKAHVAWPRAALGALGAIGVLSLLSHVLVLDYPRGILQSLVEMPWPFNQGRQLARNALRV